MKAIIVGAGAVGINLARQLSWDGHEVVVVDPQFELIEELRNYLDVMAIQGSGTSINTLTEAGAKEADLLIALTNVDEINIVSCMLAKRLGVKSCLARVRSPDFTQTELPLQLTELGIDRLIQPEKETAEEVVRLVQYPDAVDVVECSDGQVIIIGLRLPHHSPLKGEPLRSIGEKFLSPLPMRIVAVSRSGRTYIPGGKFVLEPDDLVYIIAPKREVEKVFELAGVEYRPAREVMIFGGGYIGELVAAELERQKGYRVKLIESDWAKSQRAAERLSTTMVVRSKEMADVDILTMEGLADMDVFAALSEDDENNIVTSLLARHLKCRRIITRVDRLQYLPIAKAIGLDITINEHVITADAVLAFLKKSIMVNVVKLRGLKAEVLEFSIGGNERVVGKKLKDITFPSGMLVGAIVRNSHISIAVGESVIRSGDRVVVFVESSARSEVDRFFS